MRDKVWYYFVVMSSTAGNEKDRYIGPFEDLDKAETFALLKPNETLDNYTYTVREMTHPVHF